jgi:hypothetical protein
MTQNRPRVSFFFCFFFFGPVLGRSSLFGGIKVNEDDLHFFFFGLITFSQTGKMYLSYQIGQGYWGDGGVCPQRGVFDLPKNPVDYTTSVLECPGT